VLAVDVETGQVVGTFDSQSEAARHYGLSGAGTVSVSIKKRKPIKALGIFFKKESDY